MSVVTTPEGDLIIFTETGATIWLKHERECPRCHRMVKIVENIGGVTRCPTCPPIVAVTAAEVAKWMDEAVPS